VGVERGSGGLDRRPVKDGGDTCGGGRVWSTLLAGGLVVLGLKTIGGRFHEFGPQNPGGGFEEERTARGGIEEFASRRNYLMKSTVAVR
jgi:hypothetical protein